MDLMKLPKFPIERKTLTVLSIFHKSQGKTWEDIIKFNNFTGNAVKAIKFKMSPALHDLLYKKD